MFPISLVQFYLEIILALCNILDKTSKYIVNIVNSSLFFVKFTRNSQMGYREFNPVVVD